MYKITYSVDGENRVQCSRESRGNVYGELYLSEATAQRVAEELIWEIDEDGGCYVSPIDYWVEKANPHDFTTRRQCIVIRCQRCGSEINDDILPFPMLSDLANLTWEWVIESDDFAHDAGCESSALMALLRHVPLPPHDSSE